MYVDLKDPNKSNFTTSTHKNQDVITSFLVLFDFIVLGLLGGGGLHVGALSPKHCWGTWGMAMPGDIGQLGQRFGAWAINI